MKRRLVAVSLVLALGLSGCAFSSASPEQTAFFFFFFFFFFF